MNINRPEGDNKIRVTDHNGNPVECELLFTFRSDETGKEYIVYTDDSLDENGHTRIFASVFEGNSVLTPIETEEEWNMIARILAELQQ